ncbi:hypothetical protein ACFWOX_18955 [Streptomyces sp. NPDC058467]|uniref:hypothetical protein n=1 Tax=Streptomyces sp. NPDC058467 TaxID=3346513 RepID=UPI003657FD80
MTGRIPTGSGTGPGPYIRVPARAASTAAAIATSRPAGARYAPGGRAIRARRDDLLRLLCDRAEACAHGATPVRATRTPRAISPVRAMRTPPAISPVVPMNAS